MRPARADPKFNSNAELRLLLESVADKRLWRVVFLHPPANAVYMFDMAERGWPQRFELSAVLQDVANGDFVPRTEDPMRIVSAGAATAADRRHIAHWKLINPLVTAGNEPKLMNGRTRGELIRQRCAEEKCDRKKLSSVLQKYWAGGMTFQAVATAYAKCGGSGKEREFKSRDRKPGATRTVTPGKGVARTEEVCEHLMLGAQAYLQPDGPSLESALKLVIRTFYTQAERDEHDRLVLCEADRLPTVRQLSWFIKKRFPYDYVRRRRVGDKTFELNERDLPGRGDDDVQGPGDRFEVDATIGDLFLRSAYDRRRIVGRPVIYLAVDVYSRLIVGVYVGFEGPSWIGAMMVMTNMVTNKKAFCASFGINIDETDWPSHHLPKRILADRGELMSVGLGQRIVKDLRVDIGNAQTGRGDRKPFVERLFRTIPAKFKEFVPGYILPDFGERGAADYRLDSALTLPEFTKIVLLAVLSHNLGHVGGRHLEAEMITDGGQPTPLQLWRWGVANRSGLLSVMSYDEVALAVMPRAEATVTEKGIKFKGAFYACDEAVTDNWFIKARQRTWKVVVGYDMRAMEILYLIDERLPLGYQRCELRSTSLEYLGKTLHEYEELQINQKLAQAAAKHEALPALLTYDAEMDAVREKALKATAAVDGPGLPKARRVAGIADNRAAEKAARRKSEVLSLGAPPATINLPAPPIPDETEDGGSEELQFLRRLAAKRNGS